MAFQVAVIFEGRDAAGKGGVNGAAVTKALNPRVCRVVALGAPTSHKTQSRWYFQRYVTELQARGEIIC